jgi:hypothetical protein
MTSKSAETPASSTPILDRLVPFPQPAAQESGIQIIPELCIALCIALLATLAFWHRQWIRIEVDRMILDTWTSKSGIFLGLAMGLIGFSVIAIHELGHLIAGLCVGFCCRSLFLGPIQFKGILRISLNPDPHAWWHGGAVLYPVNAEKLRERGIAMVSAGPAANLLTGCAVLLAPFPIGLFSGLFICASIVAGAVELLLPLKGRTFVFDGRRIWMMLRSRDLGERWLALMGLNAETSEGAFPESLSIDFLAKAIAVRDHSADTVAAHWFAYSAAFHRHDDAAAGQMLEVCLQYAGYVVRAQREALMSDAAIFQARRRKRIDLAAQWLAAMPATTQLSWLRPKVEAAILEARGDTDGALGKLEETEKVILSIPNPAQRALLCRLLQRWKSELNIG